MSALAPLRPPAGCERADDLHELQRWLDAEPPIDEVLQWLTEYAGPLLTAADGSLANDSERGVCALFKSGLLIINGTKRSAPEIKFVVSRALEYEHQVRDPHIRVSVRVLTDIYRQLGAATTRRKTRVREQQAVDIINMAAGVEATDIDFLLTREAGMQVRLRVDSDVTGVVAEEHYQPGLEMYHALWNMGAVTRGGSSRGEWNPNACQQTRIVDDGSMGLHANVEGLRLTYGRFHAAHGLAVRIFLRRRATDQQMTLASGGFAPDQLAALAEARALPHGMILVTGPTGSGKTTTLHRDLEAYVDVTAGTRKVVTIEDPAEGMIRGVMHRFSVTFGGEEREEAFAEMIRVALRYDPDRLSIGEIRDRATASLAFQAAQTGHLVDSTLHTNDCPGVFSRLADPAINIQPFLLFNADILACIVTQRLVPTLCPACRRSISRVSAGELELADKRWPARMRRLELIARRTGRNSLAGIHVRGQSSGCGCRKVIRGKTVTERWGVKGATAVAEVVLTDPLFMRLMREGGVDGAEKAMRHARTRAIWPARSMIEEGVNKMFDGLVDPADLERALGPLVLPEWVEVATNAAA